ncbi:hypothetical protein RND81_07G184800 [Saponaria officinalis]|uniref:Uncharacterized protein n=1 Tax=Saponaria officinalis TaxID=3572 RepID=A0AAW1JRN6_SAPOF
MEKIEEISSLKRQREVENEENDDVYKRQKSYKDIITLLEKDEDDQNDDVSSLISTLQEEIISPSSTEPVSVESDRVFSGSAGPGSEEVIKHLLEASDDELGIPSISGENSGTEMDGWDLEVGGHVDGGDLLFSVGEGLWEFEDHEANNYYSFLQSEIFM